jgi:hypothetical protein
MGTAWPAKGMAATSTRMADLLRARAVSRPGRVRHQTG